jgi:hypothetical protein
VPVVLLLAAVAILGGVVLAALGRADAMASCPGDFPPLDLDGMTAADVAVLRPPTALWGYNVPATDEALQLIAQSVTARDVEIARLRRQLAELRGGYTGGEPAMPAGHPPDPPPTTAPGPFGRDLPVWPAQPGPAADG